LEDSFALGRKETLVKLQAYAARKPSLELQHALAEIAFQEGEWASKLGQTEKAQEMYATALVSSYQFLFDQQLDLARNAYDPQFRSISDIYNRSLEEVVRRLIKQEQFRVGQVVELRTLDRTVRFSIEHPGLWNEEDVERYEIARDYQATGVNNQYHTYGLGVPLIAVRKKLEQRNESEKYYPPGLTMAFTAFLQFNESLPPQSAPPRDLDAKLSLLNPLEQVYVQVNDRWIPLESDITTPMAYFLDDPLLNTNVFATFALLNADFAQDFQGIYMLEPYDPNKIPVVMIHGLWSSPVTWLQLFNDLRADPDIRQRYQFWFCLYSSGQPFWESARQVREDLEEVRQRLVASGADSTAMQDMV
ncbi:MAG: esterase/lipase family protein, partial [Planctomycetota bacterium]